MNMYNQKSAQSILEYVIFLTAAVVAIMVATVGLNTGVRNGLSTAEQVITDRISDTAAPSEIQTRDYYVAAGEHTDAGYMANTTAYGGAEYKNEYYFHEGDSDMSYVPAVGTVLDSDTSYVAPPPAGTK